MWKPKILESDIQSENYKPESKPGAGDGQGWRLCKNGDFQIGTMSMIDGVIRNPHATVHIDRAMVDSASIKPAQLDLPIHQVHGDRPCILDDSLTQPRNYTIDLVVTLQETSPARVEALSQSIKQIVMDAIESDQHLSGVGMGLRSARITDEQTCRADADMALASRITAMDVGAGRDWAGVGAGLQLGKEYLAIQQPGGDVKLGRLGGKPVSINDLVGCMQRLQEFRDKPGHSEHEFAGGLCRDPLKGSYRDIEPTREFLAENVRSDLTPQAACALSLMAPITSNGKAPANILPRPVDDDK